MNQQPKYTVWTSPDSFSQDLEWDTLLETVSALAINTEARQELLRLPVMTEVPLIRQSLSLTHALLQLIEENLDLPFQPVEAPDDILRFLEKPGYVLDSSQLVTLARIIRNAYECTVFSRENVDESSPLYSAFSPMFHSSGQIKHIDDVLDESYEIRPDASEELMRISIEIQQAQKKLDAVFNRELQHYVEKGWLKDTAESIKNGFRVLAVKPEFKRQIPGLVVDESASGQTFFIAPQVLIAAQNNLRHLEADYQRELYRILRSTSERLRGDVPQIRSYYPALIALDILRAKALYAKKLNGQIPEIVSSPMIDIRSGVHPVLYLKNLSLGRDTVRFDLQLTAQNRILLISGPNAGGKSILLKATGLIQLMTQAGLLPPVATQTKMGVFRKIMTDIGDQQSLDEDLSTYSSRLKNMAEMLRKTDKYTLLLIDEFGSGTDPAIGGAIAESILFNFIKRKAFGVITTHYSNLKIYAANNEGIFNGAMLFDRELLTPTYQFAPGNPGSSFAYEIAEKSGIPKRVVQAARKKVGRSQTEVEDLLSQLRKEREEARCKLEEITAKGKQLDALIQQYDALKYDLFIKKKKLRIEEQQLKLQFLEEKRQALNKLVKELRQQDATSLAEEQRLRVKEERENTAKAMEDHIEEVYYQNNGDAAQLKVGDDVQLRIGGMKGKIVAINQRKGQVDCGAFTLESPLKDLIKIPPQIKRTNSGALRVKLDAKRTKFDSKLDIRGMSRSDALNTLQHFLDEALIANAFELTILHGKGNGVLKAVVREKLNEYTAVKKAFHPPPEQGGDGVTIVQLG